MVWDFNHYDSIYNFIRFMWWPICFVISAHMTRMMVRVKNKHCIPIICRFDFFAFDSAHPTIRSLVSFSPENCPFTFTRKKMKYFLNKVKHHNYMWKVHCKFHEYPRVCCKILLCLFCLYIINLQIKYLCHKTDNNYSSSNFWFNSSNK